MNIIFELDKDEAKWWKETIIEFRNKYILPPGEYVKNCIEIQKIDDASVKKQVSDFICKMREKCWDLYIRDEIQFHKKIIAYLIKERQLPSSILKELINKDFLCTSAEVSDKKVVFEKLSGLVGDFAGRIMPYFYSLSLSTTNSRRSRAGQTFEAIVTYIMMVYKYPFEDQSALGSDFYRKNGLGKIVDGVLPGAKEYEQNRAKCQIITMKTTLRERWQEVVEELSRTNIPHMYLLTLDDHLSENLLTTMQHQNITVVGYRWIKEHLQSFENMVSFDDFFNKHIPHALSFWRSVK